MKKSIEKEKEIQKNMEILGISHDEAEELYLYDHEEMDNAEADAITAKAEANSKEKKRSSIEKVKYMKAKKKKDTFKESIIGSIFAFVKGNEDMLFAQEIAANKMTFMDAAGSYYTVTVTKHTKGCPDGYNPMKEQKKNETAIEE